MKKYVKLSLSVLAALMICISMVVGISFSPVSAATDILIQDFESGTADTLSANAGCLTTRTLDTTFADDGSSLKVVYEDVSEAWNVIWVTMATTDWTGATYIKFWVKNPNAVPTAFDLFIEDASARHATTPLAPAYLIPEGEEIASQTSIGDNARLSIPSGFAGYVMIPLTSFGNLESLDLSAIVAFAFCCDAAANNGLSVYFDNFMATDSEPGELSVNIQDFDTGVVDACASNAGRPTTRSLDSTTADQGNSLKVTYEAGEDAWNVIFLSMKNTNWEGTSYIKFWINNPNTAAAEFDLFIEADAARHATTAGETAYLISDATGAASEVTIGGNARIPVPAEFVGYVMVPITSFGDSANLDLSAVTAFAFCCDAVTNFGKTFYFDSFTATSLAPVLPLPFTEGQLTGFEGTDEVGRFATAWSDGGLLGLTLDTEYIAEGDQSLKITIDGMNPGFPSQPAALAFFAVNTTDWTDSLGLTFWVYNPGEVNMDFDLFYDNSSGVRMQTITKNNSKIYYLPDGAAEATEGVCNGRFLVPAGYSGYIFIPHTAFAFALWSIDEETFDGTYDYSDITNCALGTDITNFIGQSLYLDDIKIYNETPPIEEPPVSDSSSETSSNDSSQTTSSEDDSPSTGDGSNMIIFLILGAIASLALGISKYSRRSTI